jgi:hypothetical protein
MENWTIEAHGWDDITIKKLGTSDPFSRSFPEYQTGGSQHDEALSIRWKSE